MDWDIIKDILLVATPIAVAYISYRSNKKSRKEIMTELEAKLQEKDADTANELRKMAVELENQKQLSSWEHSQPKTDEYMKEIGFMRIGKVTNLPNLIAEANNFLNTSEATNENLEKLKSLLIRIELPNENEKLYPHEIVTLFNFDELMRKIDKKIQGGEQNG